VVLGNQLRNRDKYVGLAFSLDKRIIDQDNQSQRARALACDALENIVKHFVNVL
jgi:hypothetical protein